MRLKDKNTILWENNHDFDSLVSIMSILRGDGGCPWDREQTHESIRKCLIEETYEVVEAIDTDDAELMREELGDLIFQAVFHSQIENEKGNFTVDDVISDICKKMIRRHPHVFGQAEADTSDVVSLNWDEIKKTENKGSKNCVISAPPHLPALIKAQKIQGKARKRLGIGFASKADAINYASEHIEDIPKAIFALTAAAEFEGMDAEKALNDIIRIFSEHCQMKNK